MAQRILLTVDKEPCEGLDCNLHTLKGCGRKSGRKFLLKLLGEIDPQGHSSKPIGPPWVRPSLDPESVLVLS